MTDDDGPEIGTPGCIEWTRQYLDRMVANLHEGFPHGERFEFYGTAQAPWALTASGVVSEFSGPPDRPDAAIYMQMVNVDDLWSDPRSRDAYRERLGAALAVGFEDQESGEPVFVLFFDNDADLPDELGHGSSPQVVGKGASRAASTAQTTPPPVKEPVIETDLQSWRLGNRGYKASFLDQLDYLLPGVTRLDGLPSDWPETGGFVESLNVADFAHLALQAAVTEYAVWESAAFPELVGLDPDSDWDEWLVAGFVRDSQLVMVGALEYGGVAVRAYVEGVDEKSQQAEEDESDREVGLQPGQLHL